MKRFAGPAAATPAGSARSSPRPPAPSNPLTYPDTVILAARAEDIGDDRFTMRYRIVSERLDRVAAEGEGRIVSFDYDAGAKAPLPPEIRAALLALSS
ncbi:thioesterase family protein [Nannocystis pusilla]|uniref:Thioesterase family protein n=1 Tax=Nannocystis pusilla TaxID=889268 RepID=A0A9X3J001_9BACT|nr:thioesterase family protein [Nannocystis pusilla]MCY1009565.1 thioesterase family protein [Nannocystis pusilla]